MSDRHHAFQHESGYGLIAGDANDFLQVSAKGMRHGLQKTAIASIGCIVGIGIGPNEIAFQLQVEIADTQRVDVFCAQLQRPLVRPPAGALRSEEHTSELQSRENLVCRLLLEKKKRL